MNPAEDVWAYCEGILYVLSDGFEFSAAATTDGSSHSFGAQFPQLKEVKKHSSIPIPHGSGTPVFRVTMKDGTKYYFATIQAGELVESLNQLLQAAGKR